MSTSFVAPLSVNRLRGLATRGLFTGPARTTISQEGIIVEPAPTLRSLGASRKIRSRGRVIDIIVSDTIAPSSSPMFVLRDGKRLVFAPCRGLSLDQMVMAVKEAGFDVSVHRMPGRLWWFGPLRETFAKRRLGTRLHV